MTSACPLLVSSRGSILIATVWLLLLLSIFSMAVYHRASQELVLGRWVKEQVITRTLAKAGIERVLLELTQDKFLTFEALNESWASNEKAFREIKLMGGSASVICDPEFVLGGEESKEDQQVLISETEKVAQYGACDEASRINVNFADEAVLTELFKTAVKDVAAADATKFAQAIIDWRDQDDAVMQSGAESSFYQFLPKGYKARNGPLESVEELRMIRGITSEVYDQIKPYVTVYTSDEKVNFNTASETALRALGLSQDLAKKVIAFRPGLDGILGTEDDGVFQMVEGIAPALSAQGTFTPEDFAQITNAVGKNQVGVKSKIFRIQSIGRLNRGDQTIETMITCVVKRNGMILYWHEGN